MAKAETIMAIAKVIIAAAWADGSVTNDEINSLKDLLFRLPDMTARDWAELEIYIETPIDEAERSRLVDELRKAIAKPSDKELALATLDEVIAADGSVTDAEKEMVEEIKDEIENMGVSILGPMARLLRGPVSRRSTASAPNRELYLEDFMKNKIFYMVSRHGEIGEVDFNIPDATLRKLSLAGGLMARVSYVDREVTEDEFNAIVAALQLNWGISPSEAALVAEVSVSETAKGLDLYRLGRLFFEDTTEDERVRFMEVLFVVAAGDGKVSYEETEDIRLIAKMLKLTHKQFIDAKLKIPREQRPT